ncbi:MAG: C4-dicarboxylic acid transporter DauA [Polyangiaceae bacterium]|nr:C4-dicarboxylic acid transporter DauA [Polyangiaceae bacterium]
MQQEPPERNGESASGASSRLVAAAALRATLREGYGRRELRSDVLAGLVVGIVALPLSMALAVASGTPPQHGLYTAIVAGTVIALLGGSRVQVSGPTAAFVVLLAPVAQRHGVGGLLLATGMAGALLVGLGVARLGRLIQFVPHPVITGFTAGIAVVIATTQVRDFFGLSAPSLPDHMAERAVALARALPTARWEDCAIGVFTLGALVLWPRVSTAVPSPLVALSAAGAVAWVAARAAPGFHVATIASRFSYVVDGVSFPGIPGMLPRPALPWSYPGPSGVPLGLSLGVLRELASPAIAIAVLGAIESLLSAVIADGMTGTTHDPDAELVAQGVGNLVVPFFGGFAATGALARTATNIRFGARSPVSAVVHSAFVLVAVLALAPLLGHLPMASLAALLFLVAWNMSEIRHVRHMLSVAPRGDVIVMGICFALTVLFDMVVSVTVGVVLAALLLMRRMSEITHADVLAPSAAGGAQRVPRGVVVYRVGGPLFFGAAQRAMSALEEIGAGTRAVLFDLRDVPAMDATGLVNLESAVTRLERRGVTTIVFGLQAQPRAVIERADRDRHSPRMVWVDDLDTALLLATTVAGAVGGTTPQPPGAAPSRPAGPRPEADSTRPAPPAGAA